MAGASAFAGYLLTRMLNASHPIWLLIWLLGAIVAHDLVLFPLYSALDRLVAGRRGRARVARSNGLTWRNHIRVPAVISGTLLLIASPLVLRLSDRTYFAASGLHTSVYLWHWLLVTGCLFVGSALLYALRRVRRSEHRRLRSLLRRAYPVRIRAR